MSHSPMKMLTWVIIYALHLTLLVSFRTYNSCSYFGIHICIRYCTVFFFGLHIWTQFCSSYTNYNKSSNFLHSWARINFIPISSEEKGVRSNILHFILFNAWLVFYYALISLLLFSLCTFCLKCTVTQTTGYL